MTDPSRTVAPAPVADPHATTGWEPTAPVAKAPPASPTRYALGDEIARGGMGEVYRATDTVLSREVAVKVLQAKFDTTSAIAGRFDDEARITAQLQHPNIPAVHDLGTLPDGRPFLAMKLIKGQTLDALLKARPDPTHDRGRFVAVFEQIAHALAYAHAHGVIHRDLKPANVMVGAFNETQVMDWGLAKVLGERRDVSPPVDGTDPDATRTPDPTEIKSLHNSDLMTHDGSVLGTPAYMPPEQAIGAVDQIDRRSDVFGLGAVLAVILTGRPPFQGETAESTRQLAALGKVADCFAQLDASGAEPDLVALCKRCLAPEPSDRPADASEVATAVGELRAAADERARRAEIDREKAEVQTAEGRKRRRMWLALGGVVAVLAVAAGGFGWYADRQAGAERERMARNAEAVGGLLDQVEVALRAGDAGKAGPMLAAADQRANEGGAGEWDGRRNSLQADLTVLRALDTAERFRWTAGGNFWATPEQVGGQYRAALAGFGADPEANGVGVAAGRVARSAVRERLTAVLEYVLWQGRSAAVRDGLRTLDPDPFRDAVRDAWAADDLAQLEALATRPEAADHPPGFTAVLAADERIPTDTRRRLLTAAIGRRPNDLGLLLTILGTYPINQRAGAEERIRWSQAAVAAASYSTEAWLGLGLALYDRGDTDAAIDAFKEAVRQDPKYANPHNGLGNALSLKGEVGAAIDAFKEAIRLDPTFAKPHNNLGNALYDKGELDLAIAAYEQAIRLDPTFAKPHDGRGNALYLKGEWDAAIAAFKQAVRLDPTFAKPHNNLGNALYYKGELDAAIAEYEQAINLDPKFALAHTNLGWCLEEKGDLDRGIALHKKALLLDPKEPNALESLPRAERRRHLLPRLPAVVAGTDRPTTPAEMLEFVDLCRLPFQKRYAAAVRLYEQVFAADPKLAKDMRAGHRYSAAASAALAGRGAGVDAPADERERAALRAKALTWLRADLAPRRLQATAPNGQERQSVADSLNSWLKDRDLAGLRPGLLRIGLPQSEREELDQFWAEVKATIAEANQPPKHEVLPPPRADK